MQRIAQLIKTQYTAHKSFIWYGLISVFVTVIDVTVSRLSESFVNAVVANTIGVVVGFLVQYYLTSRHVYNSKNVRTFTIFLLTFFIGLFLANLIVYFSRYYLFGGSDGAMAFLVSKGLSIVLPFFVMYYLRKRWIVDSESAK